MKDNVAQKEVTIQEVSSTLRVYHVVNFLVIKRFVGPRVAARSLSW